MPTPAVSPLHYGCMRGKECRLLRGQHLRMHGGQGRRLQPGCSIGKAGAVIRVEQPGPEWPKLCRILRGMTEEVGGETLFLKLGQILFDQHLILILDFLHLPQFDIFKGKLHSFISQPGDLSIQVLKGARNRP